jgi:hypothetical protein
MTSLAKLLALPAAERRLVARAAATVAFARVGLHLVPLAPLRRLLAGRPRGSPDPHRAERISWAVDAVTRALPGTTTCLARALAAEGLLRRHGHPAQLRIGVARTADGRFSAHAWVEIETLDGEPADARATSEFTPLPPLGAPAP